MCGIWLYILNNESHENFKTIADNFNYLCGRGPDSYSINFYKNKYFIGFTRLAIIDLSPKGNQPFVYYYNDVRYTCICNGEIYNADSIKESLLKDFKLNSDSDCEVLIPLFLLYKEGMFKFLDGVFSFIIIEESNNEIKYSIARDRIGIRPLYFGEDKYGNYIFSSELKGMKDIAIKAEQFKPSSYMLIDSNKNTEYISYFKLIDSFDYEYNEEDDSLYKLINSTLTKCVEKRLISDRPICALLSGGLDSSLVCSIASKILKEKGLKLYTYSIGIPGSPDNEYAKMVADYIGSEHTIVNISEEEALDVLEDVIMSVETYDITTIRASMGQYLVSKYISDNSNFKVVLSGDGSDEVTSGYLENYKCPSLEDLHNHTLDRIKNIHFYDVQRADRATSIHGLELRVPFLDVSFVNLFLKINAKLRMPIFGERCEKYLLRKSFSNQYLPEEVLWRQKEAFSDGISSKENSWYKIIQANCELIYNRDGNKKCLSYDINKPFSLESLYFREIFNKYYNKKFDNVIPQFWMQKWSNSNEPSARNLDIY